MTKDSFQPLFSGDSLAGWRVCPRGIARLTKDSAEYREAARHPGIWSVQGGVVTGRQDPPGCGFGSYLVSEETFGDFELIYEAKPDWPADTGVYLRASSDGAVGYQVLLDHRKSGNIGGYYGNAIGGFHAIPWNVDALRNAQGKAVGLRIEDPLTTLEPITPDKIALLTHKISGEEFLRLWKWDDWNEFRVTCQGRFPKITTAINGTLVAAIDMDAVISPKFDRERAAELGDRGHISFEVHDNDPGMGEARWGKEAACRWRSVRIREL